MSDPIGYDFGGSDEGSHYMVTRQGLARLDEEIEIPAKESCGRARIREQYARLNREASRPPVPRGVFSA